METRTFEGRTEEEAAEAAAESLGRPVASGEYRLVENRKGFWGVHRKVVIEIDVPAAAPKATPTPAPAAVVTASAAAPGVAVAGREVSLALELTRELVDGIGLSLEARGELDAGTVRVRLEGVDASRLTTRSGEVLSAIDYLVGKIALKELGPEPRIVVDAEGFRDRREEELGTLARRAADQVRKNGRKQLLPPLSPAERRLVHLALANEPDVETVSEGEGYRKRVGVVPKSS